MTTRDDQLSTQQVESFLSTLRRSVEVVQDLLEAAARRDERIRSLDAELDSARQRIAFLERETSSLRDKLATGIEPVSMRYLEELIEEQNSFAHMFVTSDRLAGARTCAEAIQIAVEVLHNLIGADHFGLWLRWEGAPVLVAPPDPRYRVADGAHADLIARALDTGVAARPAGSANGADGVPVALPLVLDGRVVGVLLIATLVPQVGGALGRLQDDLARFVVERLPARLCAAAAAQINAEQGGAGAWNAVREHLTPAAAAASPSAAGPGRGERP